MDIERDNDAAIRRLRFLMRLLTNLNAGAMLALCLWLGWAALDFNARQQEISGKVDVHGCGCALSEATSRSGFITVVENGR